MKIGAACSSEMPISYETTRRHIPEDSTLHTYFCEKLRSDTVLKNQNSNLWLNMKWRVLINFSQLLVRGSIIPFFFINSNMES
jgi:hypothetical protein